jgi:anti-anti-sigma regulatory factor/anti-sigma regulatory factor (Ser/Thr protein kinase)
VDEDNNQVEINKRLLTIGQISAGIAHEIRNPLTTVKGFLQLLQKEHDSLYWELINSELEQAITTVQNLLTVTKPDMEEEPHRYFSLTTLIENTLSLFPNVTFQKRFFNTNLKVYGKQTQIKKALFNVIKNAVEAIEEKGVITVEHYQKHHSIYIVIKDTGRGMPKEHLNLLGTPFFSTKSDTGNGLGLTQVFAAFYEHGGEIKVNSNEGQGTEFTLTLPISNEIGDEHYTVHNLKYTEDIQDFFEINRPSFNKQLEYVSKHTFEIVSKSKFVSKQDLLDHANQIITLVHNGLTQEIIQLAQERGIAWAKSDVPLISKMEWFYGLRKVIWSFLRFYHQNKNISVEEVFELADRTSEALDNFIIHFNVSFSKYRDETLRAQQLIIDELTVPLIPILHQMAVLPLIGTLDDHRMSKIEDRVLHEVESKSVQKIVIDLSGAAIFDPTILSRLMRINDGLMLLGCKVTFTGIKASLSKMLLSSDLDIHNRLHVESTLQQAIYKEMNASNGL